ncbi:MAG: ABC transporter ATP-binding protein [Methylobacteriaceae bacterium]|nr:ABC transporter ATP-binding protein [Methylobacteriaceae bacterium]
MNARTSAQDTAVYRCENVTVEFARDGGTRRVLEDISFELRRGECLSIVGPSGTGKTTLLRVLGGLLAPTGGRVFANDRVVTGAPDDIVIVFQDYSNALLPWRNVLANVALGIESKLPASVVRERVAKTLELVGLSGHARDYPWQLSGGMQQRVQIARALAGAPSVLLMDEPFAALDAMTKEALQDQLLQIQAETGCSCVFITHDIDEAIYLGDQVAVLRGSPGKFVAVEAVRLCKPRDQIITRQGPEFLHHRASLHALLRGAN